MEGLHNIRCRSLTRERWILSLSNSARREGPGPHPVVTRKKRLEALCLQDIGSSVGYRLAVKHPERVTALVIQNGEAYLEGINKEFFKPLEAYWKERTEENEKTLRAWLLTVEGTKWHYVHGARNVEAISPDNWTIDQAFEDRPGNKEIQLAILIRITPVAMAAKYTMVARPRR